MLTSKANKSGNESLFCSSGFWKVRANIDGDVYFAFKGESSFNLHENVNLSLRWKCVLSRVFGTEGTRKRNDTAIVKITRCQEIVLTTFLSTSLRDRKASKTLDFSALKKSHKPHTKLVSSSLSRLVLKIDTSILLCNLFYNHRAKVMKGIRRV